jgi:hypothetical protein
MARPIRIEVAGGWYHVTARGNQRQRIFADQRDRLHFVELLGEQTQRYGLRLHATIGTVEELSVEFRGVCGACEWGSLVDDGRRGGNGGRARAGRTKAGVSAIGGGSGAGRVAVSKGSLTIDKWIGDRECWRHATPQLRRFNC